MNGRPWARWVLRGLCSLGLIALLLSRVHWRELVALLSQARTPPLLLGALCGGFCPILIAARTRLLLAQNRVALSYSKVLQLTWLGQFFNTFLPGSTGGDAVKFLRLCRLVPDRKTASLAALMTDRLLALAALTVLAGLALTFGEGQLRRQALAGASRWMTLPVWTGALVLILVVCSSLWWIYRFYIHRFEALFTRVRSAANSLRAGLRPTPALTVAFGLAVVLQLLSMAGGWLFCLALQIPAGFGQMMILMPLMMVATLLPLTVNGHGLREYVLLFYFQAWHLTSRLPNSGGQTESAVALSLLLVMSDFFWGLPGGLCLLKNTEPSSPPDEQSEPHVAAPILNR